MSFILDTSAVLAALWDEPGGERVNEVLAEARISAVSQSELIAKLVDRGASASQVRDVIIALNLDVGEFSASQALISGELRRETKAVGLSLGDRCCLALAREESLPVLTADRAWANLNVEVEIEVIR